MAAKRARKPKTREELCADEHAFWTWAEVARVEPTNPLAPVIIQAADETGRVWPERRYTLDLRAPISTEIRAAADRKRLEREFASKFEALRREACRKDRVAVTGQVIDPADPRIDDALAYAADLVGRVTGRGEQITEDDAAHLNGMRFWLQDAPWTVPNDDDKDALAAARADVGRALGAALAALFSAVQLAHAIQHPEEIEDEAGVRKPFDWAAEPGIEEVFLHARKQTERWLAVVGRLRGAT